jgi:hypothetical protein
VTRSQGQPCLSILRVTMVELLLASPGSSASDGATDDQTRAAEEGLGVRLPDDYRALMGLANGSSKDFGNSWIVLWPVQELVERDDRLPVPSGFTYFGSNGAGEGYAWDWRPGRRALYVVMDFIDGSASAVPCGNSLEEFLATLHEGIPFRA